jgi:hypothetical protein
MYDLRQPDLWDLDAARHDPAWRRVMLSTVTRVPKVLATRAGAGETRLHFPPFLRRASAPLAALLPPKLGDLFRLEARIQEVCRAMAAVHADPVVQLLLGLDLFQRQHWPEAAAAFHEVVTRPSLLPIRRPALAALALTEWEMAKQSPDPPTSPAARRAIDHLRQYADTGEVPAEFAQGMAGIAVQAREFDLARRLLDDWRRRAPNDPRPLMSRAVTEYRAGVYSEAARMAREVLERWPGRAGAADLLRKSQDGLRKQVADLAPAPPG